MAISDFYKNNSVDTYINNGTTKGLRAKLSAPITTLYDVTVSDFDTSILIGFNTNNEYLNKYKKIGVATSTQGNYDTALNYNAGVYTLSVNEEWDTTPTILLGACLVASADKGINKLKGMWSLSRNVGITTGTAITNVDDLRFVLDVDGRGYNDLYASFTANQRNLSGQVTNDIDYVYNNSVIIYYSSNLMSSNDNTDITPYETTISLCYVIKPEDDILLASSDFLFPRWSYYSGYSHDNDKYVINYLMTGAYMPTYGYFGSGQNSYTYIFGNTNNVNNVALIPDTADKYGGDAIHDSANYTTKYRCLQLSNARKMFNTIGLKWLNANETTDIYNNIKLPLMSNTREIDCTNWVTGLSNIKISDSANVDLNINTMPEIKPPGGGGDDDDNSDDINFGYAFSGAGAFTNLWYCTQKDLADLRQWFLGADAEHPIPEGFDPMPSIIGLFQYPISLGGDVLEEIKFRTSSGLIVSTGVQAARGLSTNLKFDLGSINIPARMRERGVPFLDYESTVECYVPFCGVFQLDTQTVIGKTLSCTLWMSPATGECNCIIYTISNGIKAPVAYGSGNMSSQIPISSNGWGSYAAALKNATIQKNQIVTGAATGGISSVLSGTGNIAATLDLGEQIAGASVGSAFGAAGLALGGAGAALGLLSTGIKAYQDINAANVGIRHLKASNGTSINGAFSGQSSWNYPMTPYVKISRPHYKKPNNYAHTQGIPLVEAKKLSECSGFTMCVGADLTGITATQTERDIISAYLTNGIIV